MKSKFWSNVLLQAHIMDPYLATNNKLMNDIQNFIKEFRFKKKVSNHTQKPKKHWITPGLC